jgi:hypothetical protein
MDLDSVITGSAFEDGDAAVLTTVTATFTAARVALKPCQHVYDTATKRWGRR